MIFYGGSKQTVGTQLRCEHIWDELMYDEIGEYRSCKRCNCIDRACSESKYYGALAMQFYNVVQSGDVEKRIRDYDSLLNKIKTIEFATSIDLVLTVAFFTMIAASIFWRLDLGTICSKMFG